MKLKQDEIEMLEGKRGLPVQRAMEFLVKYGDVLGAEEMVDTQNICGTINNTTPFLDTLIDKFESFEHLVSELNYNCDDVREIPRVSAFSCQLEHGLDPDVWEKQYIKKSKFDINEKDEAISRRMNLNLICTCSPYLVGNLPVFGEHCVWMESSAVAYINTAIGARTNCEGRESSACSMLTGKTPYWGLHLPENRYGHYLVDVQYHIESVRDWGLLGYYGGMIAGEKIPVFNGIKSKPTMESYKHAGAAGASSGGTEMMHVVGLTPEARTLQEAFGSKKPEQNFVLDRAEMERTYNLLNTATNPNVDFVMLGCPHYSLRQLWETAMLLEGKKISPNLEMWVFIPRALKEVADRNGYTKIIEASGALLMADTCPALARAKPPTAKVIATDSAKQSHYMPGIFGAESYFGSTEDCVKAAITGKWEGRF
ncbi:MAG: aconitase X catalytic domain-containing protein [Deferribacteraceae bacterium]|jgi:predicted aconitase|nr:aconitase X catalytic domain-containing protein [Deferribacteraceae bacterium]